MVFYLIFILILAIVLVLPKTNTIDFRSVFFAILLSFFFSIRDYLVGTDTLNYVNNYLNNPDFFESSLELGYVSIVKILNYFNFNVSNFLFIISFISIWGLLFFYKKESKNYIFSIILAFLLGYFFLSVNIFRQALSISMVAISLFYFLEKRWVLFLIFTILSFLFHKSSLIFILPLLMISLIKKDKALYFYYFLFSLILIFFWEWGRDLISEESRYIGYNTYNEGGGGALIFFNFILWLLFLFFKKKHDFLVKYFGFSVFLGVALIYLEVHPSGPLRLIHYFTWVSAVIIPNIIVENFNAKFRSIIYMVVTIFSMIYFYFFLHSIGGLSSYEINFKGIF